MLKLQNNALLKLNNNATDDGKAWAIELNTLLEIVSSPLEKTSSALTNTESLKRAVLTILKQYKEVTGSGNVIDLNAIATNSTNNLDYTVMMRSPITNTGAVTLVTAYGSKPLRYVNASEVLTGEIQTGDLINAQYNQASATFVTFKTLVAISSINYAYNLFIGNTKIIKNTANDSHRLQTGAMELNESTSKSILRINLTGVTFTSPLQFSLIWTSSNHIVDMQISSAGAPVNTLVTVETDIPYVKVYVDAKNLYIVKPSAGDRNHVFLEEAVSKDVVTVESFNNNVSLTFQTSSLGTLIAETDSTLSTVVEPEVEKYTFEPKLLTEGEVSDININYPISRYIRTADGKSITVMSYYFATTKHQVFIETNDPLQQSHRFYDLGLVAWTALTPSTLDTTSTIISTIKGGSTTHPTLESLYDDIQLDLTKMATYTGTYLNKVGGVTELIKAPTPTIATHAVNKQYMDENIATTNAYATTIANLKGSPVGDYLNPRAVSNQDADTLTTGSGSYTLTISGLPATYSVYNIRHTTFIMQVATATLDGACYIRQISNPDGVRTFSPWEDASSANALSGPRENIHQGDTGDFYHIREISGKPSVVVKDSVDNSNRFMHIDAVQESSNGHFRVGGKHYIDIQENGTRDIAFNGLQSIGSNGYDTGTDNIIPGYKGRYGEIYINVDDGTLRGTGVFSTDIISSFGKKTNENLLFPGPIYEITKVMMNYNTIIVQTKSAMYLRGYAVGYPFNAKDANGWANTSGGDGSYLATYYVELLQSGLFIGNAAVAVTDKLYQNGFLSNAYNTNASDEMIFDAMGGPDKVRFILERNDLMWIVGENGILYAGGVSNKTPVYIGQGASTSSTVYKDALVGNYPIGSLPPVSERPLDFRFDDGGFYALIDGNWEYNGYKRLKHWGVNSATLLSRHKLSSSLTVPIKNVIIHSFGMTMVSDRVVNGLGDILATNGTGTQPGLGNTSNVNIQQVTKAGNGHQLSDLYRTYKDIITYDNIDTIHKGD